MTTRCTRLPSCAVWASCGLGLVQLQWEGILVTLGIKAVAERVVYAGRRAMPSASAALATGS